MTVKLSGPFHFTQIPIDDGAITTAKIANGAVTSDKVNGTVATTAAMNAAIATAGPYHDVFTTPNAADPTAFHAEFDVWVRDDNAIVAPFTVETTPRILTTVGGDFAVDGYGPWNPTREISCTTTGPQGVPTFNVNPNDPIIVTGTDANDQELIVNIILNDTLGNETVGAMGFFKTISQIEIPAQLTNGPGDICFGWIAGEITGNQIGAFTCVPARPFTVTTKSAPGSYSIAGEIIVEGTDINDAVLTETNYLTSGNGPETLVFDKCFKTITRVYFREQQLTTGSFKFGFGSPMGLSVEPRVEAGAMILYIEISAGAKVDTGTFLSPTNSPPNGSYEPATPPNGSNNYCLVYSRAL